MKSLLKTLAAAAAVLAAAAGVYVAFTLPPGGVRLAGGVPSDVVFGAYHVHTNRSDGAGTLDDVARAAAGAGLRFVIVTDHGDATRPPEPPAYRHGVLVIDAVEIGTADGHVVAIGLESPAPYPLAGQGRDVIEDIHRWRGWAVVAHPDSPKPGLQWRAWNTPYDGIEWLNADSEWRDESAAGLIGATARSIVRPAETVASLFQRPARTLQRWDAVLATRPVFGLAAADAHARIIGWEEGEGNPRSRTLVGWPGYAHMFRTLAQAVLLDAPLGGEAVQDARRVTAALVAGRTFSVLSAFAAPATLDFTATGNLRRIDIGGALPSNVTIRARVPQAPNARIVLLRNGREFVAGKGSVEYSGEIEPGAYRVEAYYPGFDVPWIVSSAMYARGDEPPAPPAVSPPRPAPAASVVALPVAPGDWRIERDPTTSGTAAADGALLRFDVQLGAGMPAGQYAALATNVSSDSGVDRITLTARADRPMRISLQLRLRGGREGQRWRRSVYLDQALRTVVVPLEEFEPVDVPTSQRPVVAPVQAVLLVVDTLNTRPGDRATIWIGDAALSVAK